MHTARRAVSQVISLLVVGLSFLAVWLIAGTLTMVVISLDVLVTRQASFRAPERAAGWAIVVLACLVGFYASFPVARFIARVFPVKVNGTPRYGVILTSVVAGVAYLGTAVSPRFLVENFMMLVPWSVLALGWTSLSSCSCDASLRLPTARS